MFVSLTEFRSMPIEGNGRVIQAVGERVAGQTQTSVGAFSACNADTLFVLVTSDTDVVIDGTASGSAELLPAGCPMVFPAKGRTFTTSAVPS